MSKKAKEILIKVLDKLVFVIIPSVLVSVFMMMLLRKWVYY